MSFLNLSLEHFLKCSILCHQAPPSSFDKSVEISKLIFSTTSEEDLKELMKPFGLYRKRLSNFRKFFSNSLQSDHFAKSIEIFENRKEVKTPRDPFLYKVFLEAHGRSKEPLIIAVDFDGTIRHKKKEISGCAKVLKEAESRGHSIVGWTCRFGDGLDDAKKFCIDHGIPIHFWNENSIFARRSSNPKIYADYYFDDAAFKCYGLKIDWNLFLETLKKDKKY